MQQQIVAIANLLLERVIDKPLYEYLSRPVSTGKKGVINFVEFTGLLLLETGRSVPTRRGRVSR